MDDAGDTKIPSRALKLREYSRRYYYRQRQPLNEESLEYAKVKAQVRTWGRKQQAAAFARLRQETPGLPKMVWSPQQSAPSFKVRGLTKREKKQVKKRYQQYRRDLRRQLVDGKEELQETRDRIERLSRKETNVADCPSEDVEAHFREPAEPKEQAENICIECKERVEEGVQKHCMVFHASCWEVVREGFFHRKQYLKCAVCDQKVLMKMV